ncbi:TonB-dependent receptor [Pseudoduganella sp. LjRoot289]|uniref:TonB-dependent receptor n=1 Tax=Pseudoduganella sp. LjRoot289 TaxID=3342314 RepID=UPI003ED01F26
MHKHHCGSTAAVVLSMSIIALPQAANAQEIRKPFHITAGPAANSITEFARQAGMNVLASGEHLAGVKTPEVRGELLASEALDKLLSGTCLISRVNTSGAVFIMPTTIRNPRAENPNDSTKECITMMNNAIPMQRSATCCAVMLALGSASPAMAQDSEQAISKRDGNVLETVVVTGSGIAAAYAAGIKTKRDADVMVEAIRSEDIGKMPDKNLAEALQRVPGVAIDRDGGEGRYVTLRGFGPQYNTVLFNGRRIATTENTRSFAFDTIASELIGGINVYKTQEAYLPEGGIGGTVDARTSRPLEHPGFHFAGRLEGNREGNSGKNSPNLGLTVSDTFLNNTLGVQLGLSYQKRNTATYNANNGCCGVSGGFVVDTGLPGQVIPGLENHPGYWMADTFGLKGKGLYPQEFDRTSTFEKRERKGLYGSVQYKPSSELEFVADYLYSGFNVDTQLYQTANWNYFMPPADLTFAGLKAGLSKWGDNFTDDEVNRYMGFLKANSKTVVGPNGVLSSGSGGGSPFANNELNHRPTKTQMLGLNGKWKPSRFTTVTGDFSYSKAETNNFGADQNQRRSMVSTLPGPYTYVVGPGGQAYITNSADSALAPENFGTMSMQNNYNSGSHLDASQTQFSLMLDHRLTPELKLRTGVHAEVGKKENQNYYTPSGIANLFWRTANDLKLKLTKEQFDSVVSRVYAPSASLFGQPASSDTRTFVFNNAGVNQLYLSPSIQNAVLSSCVANPAVCNQSIGGLDKLKASLAAFNAAAAANGGDPYAAQQIGTVPTNGGDPGYAVQEKIASIYTDASWNFDVAGRNATLVGGVRVTRTRTTAGGWAQVLVNLTPDTSGLPPFNSLLPTYGDGPAGNQFVTSSNSYLDVLPTLNFKFEPTDDVVLRAAASKSMTRPELGQLVPRFSYGSLGIQHREATSNSNPDLKPIKSTNFDMGAEWYYGKQASLHIDLFFKNVTGFPTTEKTDVVIPSVQPAIYNTFTVSMPVNAGSVKVHGGTLGWTQAFDSGFGFDVNTTIVRSNKHYNPNNFDPHDVNLPGLSDTMNLVGFYEKNGFSARVAFNKRKAYLATPMYEVSWPTNEFVPFVPAYQTAYKQIDARIAYEIAPKVSIYLEGTNLTNEQPRKWAFAENLIVDNPSYGRRIMLGVQGSY